MIDEVLLGLLGHTGWLIHEGEDGFFVTSDADFLSKAEHHLLSTLVQMGYQCKKLSEFANVVRKWHYSAGARAVVQLKQDVTVKSEEKPLSDDDSAGGPGHMAFGMVLKLEKQLQRYREKIAELEAELLQDDSLPLSRLPIFLEDDRRVLSMLHSLVGRIQSKQLRGAALFDLAWTTAVSHMGGGNVFDALWSLVAGAGQVLANQLVAWLMYGRLVDPASEFFIMRTEDARRLPCRAAAFGGFEDFSVQVDAATAQSEWQRLFCLRLEAIPRSVISLEVARKVLFVGKAVRVLVRSGHWLQSGTDPAVPAEVSEDVAALCDCMERKSPVYVIERSVDRIHSNASRQLRRLIVEEADLRQHLLALKGFYLLGHGSFYQTFLEAAKPLLEKHPSAHAEAELSRGPWAAACGEHEESYQAGYGGGGGSAPSTPAGGSRKAQQQRLLAQRFTVRIVPQRFEFMSFADAARQVKFVGLARLVHGHAELSASLATGGSVHPSMLWASSRQRLAQGFDHDFSFQVHWPPQSVPSLQGLEHGCRFAVSFQQNWAPEELQGWHYARNTADAASPEGAAPESLLWTGLGDCVTMEVSYRIQPSSSAAPGQSQAHVSIAFFLGQGPVNKHQLLHGSSGLQEDQWLLRQLASGTCTVSAPRGMVHMVRVAYNATSKQIQAFFGAEAVNPICSADLDLGASLSLDLGSGYVGFSLLPLDHRHAMAGREGSKQVRYSVKDRPLSIITWRHVAHPKASLFGANVSGKSRGTEGMGPEAWFSCMEISHRVSWPLPLVISQSCLEQYNSIFQLLISFRYTYGELQHLQLPRSDLAAWAFRAQLSHFVSQVLLYFQQDVIEVAHAELLQSVKVSKEFGDVTDAHDAFLDTVASQCFLEVPELSTALMKALRIANTFCMTERLSEGPASSAPTHGPRGEPRQQSGAARLSSLHGIQGEFVVVVRSLLQMLSMMQEHGLHSPVSKLLLRLDYNGFFCGDVDVADIDG